MKDALLKVLASLAGLAILVGLWWLFLANPPVNAQEASAAEAKKRFQALPAEEKFRWARDIHGMSTVMRLRQIDAIDGATDGDKARWKQEILEKYKDQPMNGPDYSRG